MGTLKLGTTPGSREGRKVRISSLWKRKTPIRKPNFCEDLASTTLQGTNQKIGVGTWRNEREDERKLKGNGEGRTLREF